MQVLLPFELAGFSNQLAGGDDDKWTDVKASNMKALSYDLELEYQARCWVNKCKTGHDKCRITKNHPSVGQNYYWTSIKVINLTTAIESFYNEKDNIDAGQFDHFTSTSSRIVDFTQMVWAHTLFVGCAAAKDATGNHIVCNYAPAGNFVNESMFLKGEPCSNCPERRSCNQKYVNLCGAIMDVPADKWSSASSAPRLFKISNVITVLLMNYSYLYVIQ